MSNQGIDNKHEEVVFGNRKKGKIYKLKMALLKKSQLFPLQFFVKCSLKKEINKKTIEKYIRFDCDNFK